MRSSAVGPASARATVCSTSRVVPLVGSKNTSEEENNEAARTKIKDRHAKEDRQTFIQTVFLRPSYRWKQAASAMATASWPRKILSHDSRESSIASDDVIQIDLRPCMTALPLATDNVLNTNIFRLSRLSSRAFSRILASLAVCLVLYRVFPLRAYIDGKDEQLVKDNFFAPDAPSGCREIRYEPIWDVFFFVLLEFVFLTVAFHRVNLAIWRITRKHFDVLILTLLFVRVLNAEVFQELRCTGFDNRGFYIVLRVILHTQTLTLFTLFDGVRLPYVVKAFLLSVAFLLTFTRAILTWIDYENLWADDVEMQYGFLVAQPREQSATGWLLISCFCLKYLYHASRSARSGLGQLVLARSPMKLVLVRGRDSRTSFSAAVAVPPALPVAVDEKKEEALVKGDANCPARSCSHASSFKGSLMLRTPINEHKSMANKHLHEDCVMENNENIIAMTSSRQTASRLTSDRNNSPAGAFASQRATHSIHSIPSMKQKQNCQQEQHYVEQMAKKMANWNIKPSGEREHGSGLARNSSRSYSLQSPSPGGVRSSKTGPAGSGMILGMSNKTSSIKPVVYDDGDKNSTGRTSSAALAGGRAAAAAVRTWSGDKIRVMRAVPSATSSCCTTPAVPSRELHRQHYFVSSSTNKNIKSPSFRSQQDVVHLQQHHELSIERVYQSSALRKKLDEIKGGVIVSSPPLAAPLREGKHTQEDIEAEAFPSSAPEVAPPPAEDGLQLLQMMPSITTHELHQAGESCELMAVAGSTRDPCTMSRSALHLDKKGREEEHIMEGELQPVGRATNVKIMGNSYPLPSIKPLFGGGQEVVQEKNNMRQTSPSCPGGQNINKRRLSAQLVEMHVAFASSDTRKRTELLWTEVKKDVQQPQGVVHVLQLSPREKQIHNQHESSQLQLAEPQDEHLLIQQQRPTAILTRTSHAASSHAGRAVLHGSGTPAEDQKVQTGASNKNNDTGEGVVQRGRSSLCDHTTGSGSELRCSVVRLQHATSTFNPRSTTPAWGACAAPPRTTGTEMMPTSSSSRPLPANNANDRTNDLSSKDANVYQMELRPTIVRIVISAESPLNTRVGRWLTQHRYYSWPLVFIVVIYVSYCWFISPVWGGIAAEEGGRGVPEYYESGMRNRSDCAEKRYILTEDLACKLFLANVVIFVACHRVSSAIFRLAIQSFDVCLMGVQFLRIVAADVTNELWCVDLRSCWPSLVLHTFWTASIFFSFCLIDALRISQRAKAILYAISAANMLYCSMESYINTSPTTSWYAKNGETMGIGVISALPRYHAANAYLWIALYLFKFCFHILRHDCCPFALISSPLALAYSSSSNRNNSSKTEMVEPKINERAPNLELLEENNIMKLNSKVENKNEGAPDFSRTTSQLQEDRVLLGDATKSSPGEREHQGAEQQPVVLSTKETPGTRSTIATTSVGVAGGGAGLRGTIGGAGGGANNCIGGAAGGGSSSSRTLSQLEALSSSKTLLTSRPLMISTNLHLASSPASSSTRQTLPTRSVRTLEVLARGALEVPGAGGGSVKICLDEREGLPRKKISAIKESMGSSDADEEHKMKAEW